MAHTFTYGLGRSGPRAANIFSVESLESRQLLSSAGALDTSFNEGLAASANLGAGSSATAVAVQTDGKTVAVGGSSSGAFAVVRYNFDGTLDTTFGPDHTGRVLTHMGNSSYARGVTLQTDGKIVVVGSQSFGQNFYFTIVRYNTDGSLDTSFDHDGIVTVPFSTNGVAFSAYANAVAVQRDGKIVVGGSVELDDPSPTGSISACAVARLNSNGSLDKSFDINGWNVTPLDDLGQINSLFIDYTVTSTPNPFYGSIVAVGTTYSDGTAVIYNSTIAIMRYTSGGNLDSRFDHDGIVELTARVGASYTIGNGATLQADGKIVVVGAVEYTFTPAQYDAEMARILPNGTLDTTFGTAGNGWVKSDFGGNDDEQLSVMPSYQDGLIVAGQSNGLDILSEYSANGVLDTTFGTNGYSRPGLTGGFAMAAGPGPRIVLAGGGSAFQVARFLDAGDNFVYAVALNSASFAYEAGSTSASFFVYRTKRLTTESDVYLSIGGTASVGASFPRPRPGDYTLDGITTAFDLSTGTIVNYVVIPANQTYAVVTLTAVDDSYIEPNETVVFTVQPDPSYDVGSPSTATLTIVDNEHQISGTIFNDVNSNGYFDSTESGISGATVYLDLNNNKIHDANEPSATTNSGGQYVFAGLSDGNYIVRQMLPPGNRRTLPSASDAYTVNLSGGSVFDHIDFGDTTNAIISGTVFNDINGNGKKDTSESALANSELYVDENKNGKYDAFEPITLTNSSGAYSFTKLPAGTWRIRPLLPQGWVVSAPVPNGYFDVTVSSGQTSSNHNFGVRITAIAGTVFNDLDKDGVKDTNESGLAGITVWIDTNGNGTFNSLPNTVGSVTYPADRYAITNSSGKYTISGLPAGSYVVREIIPGGDAQSLPTGGGTRKVTVATGQTFAGANFGLYKNVIANLSTSIVGSVFNDLNLNGTRDVENPTEPDIAGRAIWLDLNKDGVEQKTEPSTKTDAGGNFVFANLKAGVSYRVRDVLPTGWHHTKPTAGYFDVKLQTNQQVAVHFATAI